MSLFRDELVNFREDKVETYFAAAFSASVGSDKRSKFRFWGFNIDDNYFDEIYPQLKKLLPETGDVDGSGNAELADAIVALKLIAGLNISGINLNADLNGDGKIGMQEVIYILQRVTGIK